MILLIMCFTAIFAIDTQNRYPDALINQVLIATYI